MGLITKRFVIKLAIWFVLFFVSFKYKFQQLFVMISLLYIIFTNLGTRKPGQKSAYSVFNEGFEKLPGTFSSEGIDQMLRGRGSNDENEQDRKNIKANRFKTQQLDECIQQIADSYKRNKSRYANQECYCGSSKKYKKCCMNVQQLPSH